MTYQQSRPDSGAILVLALYLGLNVALIPLAPRADSLVLRRYLAVGIYVIDILFASILIHYTGGLLSQCGWRHRTVHRRRRFGGRLGQAGQKPREPGHTAIAR